MSIVTNAHIELTAKRLLALPGEWGMSQEKMEETVLQVLDALCHDGARLVIPISARHIPAGERVYNPLTTVMASWPEKKAEPSLVIDHKSKDSTLLVLVRP